MHGYFIVNIGPFMITKYDDIELIIYGINTLDKIHTTIIRSILLKIISVSVNISLEVISVRRKIGERFFGVKFFKKLSEVDAFHHLGEKDLATLILKAANVIIDIWFWLCNFVIIFIIGSLIWFLIDSDIMTEAIFYDLLNNGIFFIIMFFVFIFASYGFIIIVKNQEDQIRERYSKNDEKK